MQYPRIKPLAIAIIVPLIILLTVGLGLSLPRLLVKPAHNFVYTYYSGNDYESYTVTDGAVVVTKNPYTSSYTTPRHPVLYLYDFGTNTSHVISPAETTRYALSTNVTSADGYVISTGRSGGSDFSSLINFSEQNYNTIFAHNSWGDKKLNISSQDTDPYSYFTFVGWVTK